MADFNKAQLYLVTPKACELGFYTQVLIPVLDAVEVSCLRLGLASDDPDALTRHLDLAREIAHARDIPIVVTDHAKLVEPLGLDGVHVTNGIQNLREIRKSLGAEAIIGVSCQNSKHQGMTAGEIGVDYVSFGPVSETPIHDEVAPADLFEWWSQMIEIPVVAEGAVSPEAIKSLKDSVDFFAIGEEIWGADKDPAKLLKDLNSRL